MTENRLSHSGCTVSHIVRTFKIAPCQFSKVLSLSEKILNAFAQGTWQSTCATTQDGCTNVMAFSLTFPDIEVRTRQRSKKDFSFWVQKSKKLHLRFDLFCSIIKIRDVGLEIPWAFACGTISDTCRSQYPSSQHLHAPSSKFGQVARRTLRNQDRLWRGASMS